MIVLNFFLQLTLHFAVASTFTIGELKSVGTTTEESNTVQELMSSAVTGAGHHSVVGKNGQFVLNPRLVKLGSAYIFTVEKYKNDESIFSSQMKAQRFDEIDNVVTRVVESAIDEVAVNKNGKVDSVTENEVTGSLRRRGTINRWYIGFGPAGGVNVGDQNTFFNFALGYFFEIDPHSAIKVFYDQTSDRFGYVGLGANYYFSDRDQSPLITADLGYGGASIRNKDDNIFSHVESVHGFAAGVGAGYQFFRTSKVNMEVLFHVASLLNSNRDGLPLKYGLRVGVYF